MLNIRCKRCRLVYCDIFEWRKMAEELYRDALDFDRDTWKVAFGTSPKLDPASEEVQVPTLAIIPGDPNSIPFPIFIVGCDVGYRILRLFVVPYSPLMHCFTWWKQSTITCETNFIGPHFLFFRHHYLLRIIYMYYWSAALSHDPRERPAVSHYAFWFTNVPGHPFLAFGNEYDSVISVPRFEGEL